LFAIGLMNASLMAPSVLPLTTTYAITEASVSSAESTSRSAKPCLQTIYTSLIVLVPGWRCSQARRWR